MKRMKQFLVCGLSVAVAACGQGCGPATQVTQAQTAAAANTSNTASPQDSLERVTVGAPVRKTLTLFSTQPGWIKAFEETPLHPKVTGYVAEVSVDIGESVTKGQKLLTIAVPELEDDIKRHEALVVQAQAEVRQAEAAINAARAGSRTQQAKLKGVEAGLERTRGEYDRWTAEYARMKELASRGTVTDKLVEETLSQYRAADASRAEAEAGIASAQAAVEEAQAQVASAEANLVAAQARVGVAQANLAQAQTLLAYATILAPYDGIITRRSVDTGHLVKEASGPAAEALLTIVRADMVRVFVDIPETEAPLVTSGAEGGDPAQVSVQSLGSRTFDSSVMRTSWTLNPVNRSLLAEVDVPNADGLLRPGMYASVRVQLDERRDALTVPAAAIVRDGAQTLCCTIVDGKVARRPVETGLRVGDEVEIRSGLTEKDQVVLARAGSLKDGQSVEVLLLEKK